MIAKLILVPGGGIVRIHLLEFPQKIHQALYVFRRNGLLNDHVAARDPVLPVIRREFSQGKRLLDIAELGFGDVSYAGISRAVFTVGIAIHVVLLWVRQVSVTAAGNDLQ